MNKFNKADEKINYARWKQDALIYQSWICDRSRKISTDSDKAPEVYDYVVSLFRNTVESGHTMFVANVGYRLSTDSEPTRNNRGKYTFETRYPRLIQYELDLHDKEDLERRMNSLYVNYSEDDHYKTVYENIGPNYDSGRFVLGGIGISDVTAEPIPHTWFLLDANIEEGSIETKVGGSRVVQSAYTLSGIKLSCAINGFTFETAIPDEMIRSSAYNRYPMLRKTKEAIRRIR